jgi:hypothetical protein
MKKRLIILILLLIVLAFIAGLYSRPRIYNAHENAGIAWNWGGLETRGAPGLFICPGSYNPQTGQYSPNPLAHLLPSLVTDC